MNSSPKSLKKSASARLDAPWFCGKLPLVSPRPMYEVKRSILRKIALRIRREACLCD